MYFFRIFGNAAMDGIAAKSWLFEAGFHRLEKIIVLDERWPRV